MNRRKVMTRADWDRLYLTQRVPCNAMDNDPSRSLCALREGHDGPHATRTDGGRTFADSRGRIDR